MNLILKKKKKNYVPHEKESQWVNDLNILDELFL